MIEYKTIKCSLNDVPKTGNYHVINLRDDQYWFVNGLKHRDNDQPAIIFNSGSQFWYQHGKLHRDNDLPACIYTNGAQFWFQNDKLHRDNDNPAVIYSNGKQEWYKNGIQYNPIKITKSIIDLDHEIKEIQNNLSYKEEKLLLDVSTEILDRMDETSITSNNLIKITGIKNINKILSGDVDLKLSHLNRIAHALNTSVEIKLKPNDKNNYNYIVNKICIHDEYIDIKHIFITDNKYKAKKWVDLYNKKQKDENIKAQYFEILVK